MDDFASFSGVIALRFWRTYVGIVLAPKNKRHVHSALGCLSEQLPSRAVCRGTRHTGSVASLRVGEVQCIFCCGNLKSDVVS
mgnify:FL=1